ISVRTLAHGLSAVSVRISIRRGVVPSLVLGLTIFPWRVDIPVRNGCWSGQHLGIRILPLLWNVRHTTFRNPVARAEQCPVASSDPHGPDRALLIVEHLHRPNWLARSAIHGKPIIRAVEADLIAASFCFGGPKSSIGIQVQLG